jgi:hypothetical protein
MVAAIACALPAGASASGSSSGGSSSGGGYSGGGASSAPSPHAGNTSATDSSVKTSVSCTGAAGQSCPFTATIAVQETLRGGKLVAVTSRKRKRTSVRHITVVLGRATATVAAGATRELTVELSAAGLHLLSSRHSLPVRFTVSSATAGPYTETHLLDEIDLTLHAARAKHKR